MKKLLAGLLSTAMVFTLAGCGSSKDHLAAIQDKGEITIGLEGDWQPFSYHDKDDQLMGVDVEVAKNIAKKLGVKANIVEGKWDGLLTGLSTGTYDLVINGVDITKEREKKFDFSTPYAYDHTVLVVRNDNTTITSLDDLKGKTTANSIGSTYMELGEDYGATVKGVDDLTKCMDLVKSGGVDATINAATSINDYLQTTKDSSFKIVDQSKESTPYAIPAGLKPKKDGLITEVQEVGSDNPFINVIVARTADKDNEDYQKVVKAYQSQLVAEYILEKNKGASVPAFDYDKDYKVDKNFVSDIEGYQSSSDGKKVIKIGTCGSADTFRAVQKVLDDENSGIYLDVVVFDAYNLPNEALNNGEIDLNSFQHKAYLKNECEAQGYDLTAIGDTSSAPLTLYSKKVDSLKALKELAGKKEN